MAGGGEERCCEAMFWVYLIISIGLVLFAGLMSGLTLGLMSLSLVDLEVLVKAGKPKDQLHAGLLPPSPLSSPSSLFLLHHTHRPVVLLLLLLCPQPRFCPWSRISTFCSAPCSSATRSPWRSQLSFLPPSHFLSLCAKFGFLVLLIASHAIYV